MIYDHYKKEDPSHWLIWKPLDHKNWYHLKNYKCKLGSIRHPVKLATVLDAVLKDIYLRHINTLEPFANDPRGI